MVVDYEILCDIESETMIVIYYMIGLGNGESEPGLLTSGTLSFGNPYFPLVFSMIQLYSVPFCGYGHPDWSESQNIFDPNGDNYSADNIEALRGMKLMIVMVTVK